jgi:hypothetical protein
MRALAAAGGLALGALGAGLGLAGCGGQSPAAAPSPPAGIMGTPATATGTSASAGGDQAQSAAPASTPAPAVTKTVTKVATVSPAAPASTAAPPAAQTPAPQTPAAQTPAGQTPAGQPAAQPPGGPNVTDPWAVVSAYYGDIDSGAYAQAYALIGNGATTGQSYQQFAAGFACTGSQLVSENWESGSSVNFDLTAGDSCNGSTRYYTGTDTVENGTIVGADITQTG